METALTQQKNVSENSEADGDRLIQLSRALANTQRLAGIGSLSASTARELTHPLNIITASCSNLLCELEEKDQDQESLLYHVALIERSAFRIAQIARVLQDYARADEPQMVVTHVNMLVHDALALVEKQFKEESNIRFEVDIDQQLGTVVCDHHRITQVLVNLLANARDAMSPEGGIIYLNFGFVQKVAARAERNGQSGGEPRQFAFSVRDSGHGLAADILNDIFQPFFSTRSNGQGVGLGLFVAKGIVDQHNGRIFAVNNPQPDQGATFTVVIPLRPPL